MAGAGLYTRPVRCRYCDRVFDFPTLTTDINERDVPVRTRTCGNCLWEMGQNEELRVARSKAEEANRRSVTSLCERNVINGHKSSLSSVGTNDATTTESDATSRSTESPEQPHLRLPKSETKPRHTIRSLSESRASSAVHDLLN